MTKFGSLKRDNEEKPKLVKPSPDGTIESSSDTLPTPPDGGWGWMVVLGSFMIHVIADGVAYSFGIFLSDLIDHFDAGRGEVGWISSLMVGMTFCSGESKVPGGQGTRVPLVLCLDFLNIYWIFHASHLECYHIKLLNVMYFSEISQQNWNTV